MISGACHSPQIIPGADGIQRGSASHVTIVLRGGRAIMNVCG